MERSPRGQLPNNGMLHPALQLPQEQLRRVLRQIGVSFQTGICRFASQNRTAARMSAFVRSSRGRTAISAEPQVSAVPATSRLLRPLRRNAEAERTPEFLFTDILPFFPFALALTNGPNDRHPGTRVGMANSPAPAPRHSG